MENDSMETLSDYPEDRSGSEANFACANHVLLYDPNRKFILKYSEVTETVVDSFNVDLPDLLHNAFY